MLKLLLLLSFIIHAVSLYWIYRNKNNSSDNKEIESLLVMYTEEMKAENEKLLNRLRLFEEKGASAMATGSAVENSESGNLQSETAEATVVKSQMDVLPPVSGAPGDHVEVTRTAQVLALSKQGEKQTEIAKKLDCTTDEVQLILKLYQ